MVITGYTSIVGGKRVKKSSYIIEAIGNVDELNAFLGFVSKLFKTLIKKKLYKIFKMIYLI